MSDYKHQRYSVLDVNGYELDCFHYPFTLDEEVIFSNTKEILSIYLMNSLGMDIVDSIEVFDPIAVSTNNVEVFQDDVVYVKINGIEKLVTLKESDDGKHVFGVAEDGSKHLLTTEMLEYVVIHHEEENDYDYYDDYACDNFCCACCGCMCDFDDPDDWEEDETE